MHDDEDDRDDGDHDDDKGDYEHDDQDNDRDSSDELHQRRAHSQNMCVLKRLSSVQYIAQVFVGGVDSCDETFQS